MIKALNGRKLLSLAVAFGLALPVAASAFGSSGVIEPVEVRVEYSDLDLASEAGARTLYWRLKDAVSQACGPTSLRLAGSLRQVRINQTCHQELLDKAVEQADSDLLRAIHAS